MSSLPLGLIAYKYATVALAPAVPFLLKQRAGRGKEDLSRIGERLGWPGAPRPEGALIWIHGASVGETLAALPLIDRLIKGGVNVLVTSGTVTSAALMAERLPRGALHQFAPIDTPAAIARFLDHWKPDAGLFVDSEIWPNMILSSKERGVRLALINARVSERSFEGWRRAPRSAAALFSAFDICLAQDEEIAQRLRALGAREVEVVGSLKADAPPLPADPAELERLRAAIAGRPVFVAASTHSGEEETILPAHDALRRKFPDLLTIIAPRHPARGAEIEMLSGTRKSVRRSAGALPVAAVAIYIADTLGELGLFYRLAPFAFIGGSLVPHGGQNPLEPARLNCAVLAGPHTANFRVAYETILTAQGGGRVTTCAELTDAAARLLSDPAGAKAWGAAAAASAATLSGAIDKTSLMISRMLATHAPG